MLDRLITTKMSAGVVADMLRRGYGIGEIAQVIKAPISFVRGVQAKRHVLTMKDIKAIARHVGESPHLMLLNAIPPSEMKPELKELFDSTRQVLETSAACATRTTSKTSKKRRTRPKAA